MTSWDYFISGFRLITQKGVRRYVVIPLLINSLLFAGLLWFGGHEFHRLTTWLEGFLPTWLEWLSVILWLLFFVVVVIALVYTFSLVANLLAAPFNGFLSEKVEQVLRGKKVESPMRWSDLIKEGPRMIVRQLHYILYYLSRVILVVILFFIPGLQLLATPFWYALSAWMMSVQYMDYPMDNHRIDFPHMRKMLAQKRMTNFGFGTFVLIASMIPVVNFIVIPAAVAGATHLFVEEYGNTLPGT